MGIIVNALLLRCDCLKLLATPCTLTPCIGTFAIMLKKVMVFIDTHIKGVSPLEIIEEQKDNELHRQ